jgi:hypothetical protein
MSVTCINCFTISLRDMKGSAALQVLDPEMFAGRAFRRTTVLLEYVSCDVLARIGTALLTKFMVTTGRAYNVGCSKEGMAAQAVFRVRYFRSAQSANCVERFSRVPGRRF